MNKYIIYTTEGHTTAPNEVVEVENCQVLGCANGKNKQEAVKNLLENNLWITEAHFSTAEFIVQPLLTEEILSDIKKVVDYLWMDEERHYLERGNYPRNQIFRVLERLKSISQPF
ncbi:MAG: hypothetical protein IJ197_08430 [Bacteroidaceae bacterium]|nr:hypothetical protein [Bacteroidaceae bacterium]